MYKIIFLILCWAALTTFAEKPSWFPDNDIELMKKCENETLSGPGCLRLKFHAYYLCCAKVLNIYNEDTGLNVERLTYSLFESTDCGKPLVQYCFDQHKEIISKGEMISETLKCILEKKNEGEVNC
ncbi:hypothetical protein FF38_11676 [Lucilia cuprina]|uniref:Uncharacterized protein n=1 Tax=Lucilia cuprina TaxID=7375 RepID=A0A0L0CEN3_LUCCU|nr:hypothetical protein CVS40_6246 [Lucilia cuprina]KNC30711.1 hypothetical protein FF38_11676 [Lucilia cuprina]